MAIQPKDVTARTSVLDKVTFIATAMGQSVAEVAERIGVTKGGKMVDKYDFEKQCPSEELVHVTAAEKKLTYAFLPGVEQTETGKAMLAKLPPLAEGIFSTFQSSTRRAWNSRFARLSSPLQTRKAPHFCSPRGLRMSMYGAIAV
jgi:hypothetical protein